MCETTPGGSEVLYWRALEGLGAGLAEVKFVTFWREKSGEMKGKSGMFLFLNNFSDIVQIFGNDELAGSSGD